VPALPCCIAAAAGNFGLTCCAAALLINCRIEICRVYRPLGVTWLAFGWASSCFDDLLLLRLGLEANEGGIPMTF